MGHPDVRCFVGEAEDPRRGGKDDAGGDVDQILCTAIGATFQTPSS
jgi:hypothetical protein